MLSINNIRWDHKPFAHTQDLINVLATRLQKFNISINLKTTSTGIVFNDLDNGKTFKSSVYNKRYMKEDDPRIKSKGRKYLESEQPTEKQYYGFFNTVQETLDELGLNADVVLKLKKDTIILRENKVTYNRIPVIKSFPVEK